MKFVRPPRCPEHPEWDVSLEVKTFEIDGIPRWRCAACNRLLGAAGAGREVWVAFPWHRWKWRKIQPDAQTMAVMDVEWCTQVAAGRLPQTREGGDEDPVGADEDPPCPDCGIPGCVCP